MFATLIRVGSDGRRHPDRSGASEHSMRPHDDLALIPLLGVVQQPLAKVVVDRGVGTSPGGAGQGDGADPRTLARTSSSGWRRRTRPLVPTQKQDHLGYAERRPSTTVAGRKGTGPSPAPRAPSTTFSSSPDPDAGGGPLRHRLHVMARRQRVLIRIQQRLPGRQTGSCRLEALQACRARAGGRPIRPCRGRQMTLTVALALPSWRVSVSSGQRPSAAAASFQGELVPPSGAKSKAADPDRARTRTVD